MIQKGSSCWLITDRGRALFLEFQAHCLLILTVSLEDAEADRVMPLLRVMWH